MLFTSSVLYAALALAPSRTEPHAAPSHATCEPPTTPRAPAADREVSRPPRSGPMGRAGIGLMVSGGITMVVGAGVIVPIAIGSALREPAPNPANYTAVEPYVQDLAGYRAAMGRSMTLAVAGSIVAVVGATSFTTGAILWGVSRRRARAEAQRWSWSVAPGRRAVAASIRLRF